MEDLQKRSILKTFTWRVAASLDTFVIGWVITGNWNKIEWGKNKERFI